MSRKIEFLKRLCVLALTLFTLSLNCQAIPIPEGAKLESVTDLGFGFCEVNVLIPNSREIGHHTFLYYQDQIICSPRNCSVSPSGIYVIYQDGPSGNLFLYRRADGKRAQLTHFAKSVPHVVDFVWHEQVGTVDWHYGTEYRRIQEVMEDEEP